MSKFASKRFVSLFSGTAAIGLLAGLGLAPSLAAAPANGARPVFSDNNTGWISIGTDYDPVPGGPQPVTYDPAHRYVPNGSGEQSTFRIADTNNPNLTDFAKAELKKSNDLVLSGFAMFARESRCWMSGTPVYLLNPAQPTFILQEPKKITMMWQMDQQIRHIYMDVPHSANPKPSWYGESVGHWEGDTLIVDTIGQNTKTFIDNYRTPHSEKLHVVERIRLIEGGEKLEADITMDDPAVLKQPLHVIHRWRKAPGPMIESRCADGEMNNPFQQRTEPLPVAAKADF